MDHGTDDAGNDAAIAAVRNISHIATLPEVTVEIIELVENPVSSARDLHRLVAADPALTARMLKVVNSAFYGLPRQIASINRAVSLLGLNAVKNIAIAASLAKLFRGGAIGPHFDAHHLWNHSCATAAAARTVARKCGRKWIADEAFLAGLVHDVGILVELQHDRVAFTNAIEEGVETGDLESSEINHLGDTHERFGSVLCEHWKFPESLVGVVGHHHDPLRLPESARELPCIIHVADHVAGQVAGGFTLDLRPDGPDPLVLDALELGDSALREIRLAVLEAVGNGDEMMAAA